jgi:hypothetical protein
MWKITGLWEDRIRLSHFWSYCDDFWFLRTYPDSLRVQSWQTLDDGERVGLWNVHRFAKFETALNPNSILPCTLYLIFMFPCIITGYMKMTNKMQLCRMIYYSLAALHVSRDIFARHQEHLTVLQPLTLHTFVAVSWYHGSAETLPWYQLAATYVCNTSNTVVMLLMMSENIARNM